MAGAIKMIPAPAQAFFWGGKQSRNDIYAVSTGKGLASHRSRPTLHPSRHPVSPSGNGLYVIASGRDGGQLEELSMNEKRLRRYALNACVLLVAIGCAASMYEERYVKNGALFQIWPAFQLQFSITLVLGYAMAQLRITYRVAIIAIVIVTVLPFAILGLPDPSVYFFWLAAFAAGLLGTSTGHLMQSNTRSLH